MATFVPRGLLFLPLVLIAAWTEAALTQDSKPHYTRTIQFAPLRISQEDLLDTLERTSQLIETANRGVESQYVRERLTFSDGNSSITLTRPFDRSSLRSAPPITTSLEYEYESYKSPVSLVRLRLWDTTRELTVSGSAQEQIEALTAVVANSLNESAVWFGGLRARFIGGLLLMLLGIFGPLLLSRILTPYIATAIYIVGFVIAAGTWFLPWDRWFPGTAVFRGDASFLVRHGPLISFLGLVLTIMTFLIATAITYYQGRLEVGAKPPQQPSKTQAP